ncbi:unnamed protein product [Rhizoctonia solani]|uniref:Uncharacterized protein n=1 Tax=Rhizoctonia solani TaxID=456999 RepID=A0A8H3AIV0_9AGAM|nr:unnamed protein product [Rhizoctonia solani]
MKLAQSLRTATERARHTKKSLRHHITGLRLLCNCKRCWPEQRTQIPATIDTHRKRYGVHPDLRGHVGTPLAPPVASGSNHSPPPAKTIRNKPTCDGSTIKQFPGNTPDNTPDNIPDDVLETYPSNSTSSEGSDAGELDHLIQLGDPDRDVDFFGPLLRSR